MVRNIYIIMLQLFNIHSYIIYLKYRVYIYVTTTIFDTVANTLWCAVVICYLIDYYFVTLLNHAA